MHERILLLLFRFLGPGFGEPEPQTRFRIYRFGVSFGGFYWFHKLCWGLWRSEQVVIAYPCIPHDIVQEPRPRVRLKPGLFGSWHSGFLLPN